LYVLHQPIAVASLVVGWALPLPVEYAGLVTISPLLTPAAYELLVRRARVTPFGFGMRTTSRS
jgi:hypothetical protein